MSTVPGWDCTHSNIAHVPSGQGAGYTTGTSDIAWTPADWAAHPHAVRIDQDARAGDGTADVLDVEQGAATPAECPGWVNRARASYSAATRPGQRHPAIYVNRSNVTAVANALTSAGLTGVGLWVADWNLTSTEAAQEVATASGPFPVVAIQYSDQGGRGAYDLDVFSTAWLNTVSGKTPPPAHKTWKEWDTAGDLSLAAFAAKFGVGPATLLADTAVHFGYFNPPLGNYIKGLAEGTVKPTDPMPKGCRFWIHA